LPKRAKNRDRTASGRLVFERTRQRNRALLLTLLTFCPPGPPLRANVNVNSCMGICRPAATVSVKVDFIVQPIVLSTTTGRNFAFKLL